MQKKDVFFSHKGKQNPKELKNAKEKYMIIRNFIIDNDLNF